MKRGLIITSIVTGVLAAAFLFMAVERNAAANDTSAALEVISQGLDWDGSTPITMDEQTDRMNANLDVLVSQKSQRNTQGILAFLMIAATGGLAFCVRKQGN